VIRCFIASHIEILDNPLWKDVLRTEDRADLVRKSSEVTNQSMQVTHLDLPYCILLVKVSKFRTANVQR
jgi:hypothetical protein